jgi:hypothetical protein
MAAIDNRLDLAVRELRALNDVPGDWRQHAGRIVERCSQALRRSGHIRMAVALTPFCESADPLQAVQAIEDVAAKMQEERETV